MPGHANETGFDEASRRTLEDGRVAQPRSAERKAAGAQAGVGAQVHEEKMRPR